MRSGDGTRPDRPVGVLSVVLKDPARPGRTLLGVRRPSALSPRHPGVLSTPTMRVPDDIFALVSAGLPDPSGLPGIRPVDSEPFGVGRGARVTFVSSYALEMLFCAKLGLADALGRGDFEAFARLRFLSLEEVGDPLGTEAGEWTAMLSFEVTVISGGTALPVATGAYSRLVWVEAAKIPRALADRDALLLDETLDATEVCVQGLCVRVAAEMLVGDT